jgi:DNA polymerase elongation subunit (family B)
LNDTYKTTLLDDKNEKEKFKIISINTKKDRITIGIPKAIKIDEISQDFNIILSETNDEYNSTRAIIDENSNLFIQLDRPIVQDIFIPKTTRSRGHTTVKFKNAVVSANLPHVVLARKLKKRNPENPPKTNDRIPYIFIESENTELFKKVEDPEYAKRNDLKIDTKYYIGAIKTPISQILELFDKELPNKIFL